MTNSQNTDHAARHGERTVVILSVLQSTADPWCFREIRGKAVFAVEILPTH